MIERLLRWLRSLFAWPVVDVDFEGLSAAIAEDAERIFGARG